MRDQQTKVPTHIYVLIGTLAVAGALGIVAYNQAQMAAMLENPELVQKVVESNALRTSIERETDSSLSALDLEALLNESNVLQSMVTRSVSDQLAGYGSTTAFHDAVASALPEQPRVDDNSTKLDQLQSKISQYEVQLTEIAARVEDDQSAHAVNQLQGQLIELQQLIGSLSEEVQCTLSVPNRSRSSFLLKERRTTNLRGYDLVVTLGRIKKDVIDSVAISAPNADRTQTDTKIVGNVTLGIPLEFQSGGHSYEGVFTFRQARIGPDFIGFEVMETALSTEECLQAESVASL